MTWLTSAGHSLYHILFHHDKQAHAPESSTAASSATFGILCFEAAKMMSRLVSLYRSLSDNEIRRLRKDVLKSKGVAYLNSQDEDHLLHIACAELVHDLDYVAAAVSRFGAKCSDTAHGLQRFDLLYADLKLGLIDLKKIEFGSRNLQRVVERMDKLVSSTANLYTALESLLELEHSEKKIVSRWKQSSEILKQCGKANPDLFQQRIVFLRKQIKSYKEASLWSQSYDKSVGLMARIVCVAYARIHVVFGPYCISLSGLDHSPSERCPREDWNLQLQRNKRATKFSPIGLGLGLVVCPLRSPGWESFDRLTGCESGKDDALSRLASQDTVGGSALTARYANLIILAEKCLYAPETVNDYTRGELYEMLPEKLRRTVRAKLKRRWGLRKERHGLAEDGVDEERGGSSGHALAEGWRDALDEIMTWLAPMAHDTMTWQAERNLDRQRSYFVATSGKAPSSSVLLLQTLHFSDLEKTEAAIVEVMVGLSCVFRYENLRHAGDHHHHDHHDYKCV